MARRSALSGAMPPRASPQSTSINVRGGAGWAAMAVATSGSSVMILTSAPEALSLATWSSFCGVMPTA